MDIAVHMQCIIECSILIILINQQLLTMLITVTHKIDDVGMPNFRDTRN
uniref:Uncharacterized protein n=1 Tax=Rhizophora mucronata TaxID=61149 RepID=A0A2P2PU05_RHIMU